MDPDELVDASRQDSPTGLLDDPDALAGLAASIEAHYGERYDLER